MAWCLDMAALKGVVHVGRHHEACQFTAGVFEPKRALQLNLLARAKGGPLREDEHVLEVELDVVDDTHRGESRGGGRIVCAHVKLGAEYTECRRAHGRLL